MSAETEFRITKKVCRCCGERKAMEEFYREPRTRSGRTSYCKSCLHAQARARYHRRKGAEHRAKWAAIAAEAAASA